MTTSASTAATPTSSRRWLALGLIATAQFMVIMDTSIIGVALPKMQTALNFDPQDLSWVFTPMSSPLLACYSWAVASPTSSAPAGSSPPAG
jgi:MFS family permease